MIMQYAQCKLIYLLHCLLAFDRNLVPVFVLMED